MQLTYCRVYALCLQGLLVGWVVPRTGPGVVPKKIFLIGNDSNVAIYVLLCRSSLNAVIVSLHSAFLVVT